jgi:hypothetical protein
LAPDADGKFVTQRVFYDVGPEVSKNVPMLIGNASEEGDPMRSRPTEDAAQSIFCIEARSLGPSRRSFMNWRASSLD